MTSELIARLRARAAEALDNMPDYDWASITSDRFGRWQCSPKDASDMARDAARAVLFAFDLTEAADALSRTCDTCRHREPTEGIAFCARYPQGEWAHPLITCEELGHCCGRWEPQ
jgi:hypothetical protein